jgi:NDP-sugar pyrophosphorylase family protein
VHGLILAGGEGTRLTADGVASPKPLVQVAGRPQVVRLAEALWRVGCRSVTVMVRAEFADRVRQTLSHAGPGPIRVEPCRTPSSLHTLAAGLALAPDGPVLCTMVDTVMRPADWPPLADGLRRGLAAGREVMLAVTPYVDDEAPLWVRRAHGGEVTGLGSEPVSPPCVTGGVYAFSAAARDLAGGAVERGLTRMRQFLAWAVTEGSRVGSVDVVRIIDLDRRRDLELASAWLGGGPSGGIAP